MKVPDWLRDLMIAVGAFVGGRVVNGVSEQMKEGRELRRSVDRLTLSVEGVQQEIRDQVTGLKRELHEHIRQQESQFLQVNRRVETVNGRVDALTQMVGQTGCANFARHHEEREPES